MRLPSGFAGAAHGCVRAASSADVTKPEHGVPAYGGVSSEAIPSLANTHIKQGVCVHLHPWPTRFTLVSERQGSIDNEKRSEVWWTVFT